MRDMAAKFASKYLLTMQRQVRAVSPLQRCRAFR
jgi:hypothetical protein